MAVTLPGAEAVRQVNVRRDPGVRVPGATSSGLQELGSAISQVGAQFQAANDARVLSNLESETARAYTDFQAELETDPDSFEEWEGKFDEFAKKHRDETKKSGANRTVTGAWERSIGPIESRTRLKIMGKARETMVNKGLAELKVNLQGAQDLAITGTKKDRDDLYGPQAKLMVERARATGLISRTTADSLDEEFASGVEKSRFKNGLTIDPEATKESLAAGDFEVPETERPAWEKLADAAIKDKKRQAKADEKDAREQSYYDAVRGVNEWLEDDKSLFEIKTEFLPQFSEDSKGAEQVRKYIESRFKDQNAIDWDMYIAGQNEIDRRAEVGDPMTNEEVELNYGEDTGKQLRHLLSRNSAAIKRMSQQSYVRANTKLKKSLGAGDFGIPTGKKAKKLYSEIGKELTQYMDENPQGDASEWVGKRMDVNDKETRLEALDGWSPFRKTEFESFEDLSDEDMAIELLSQKGVQDPSDGLVKRVLANTEFQQYKLDRLEEIKGSL